MDAVVRVNPSELSTLLEATAYAGEHGSKDLRRDARQAEGSLLAARPDVIAARPGRAEVFLNPGEYQTLLKAMEFLVANVSPGMEIKQRVGDLWSWWLVDGGLANAEEIVALRRKYGLEE